MELLLQGISFVGAICVLGAYLALHRKQCSNTDSLYLWANIVGAALLTVVAVADRRVGFIALEGAWALISLWTLVNTRGGRSEAAT
jgi:hypothetical protein